MDTTLVDRVIQTAIICIVCFLSIFGNSVSIMVLSRTNKIPVTTRCFMTSLAFSNLGVGLIGTFSIPAAITREWVYGRGWCQFCGVQLHVFLSASIGSLLLISVERFVAITMPFRYIRWFTLRRVLIGIALKWIILELYAVVLGTIVHARFYSYFKSAYICYPRYGAADFAVTTVVTMTFFVFIPSAVIIIIYLRIIQISWGHTRKIGRQMSRSNEHNGTRKAMTPERRNLKAARMFLVVWGGFQVTWYPYAVITTLNSQSGFFRDTPWLVFGIIWLGTSSSVLNFLVYSLMNGAFRATAKQTIAACFGCKNVQNNPNRVSPSVFDVQSESIGKTKVLDKSIEKDSFVTETTRVGDDNCSMVEI